MSLIFLDLPLPNLMVNPFQQTKTNTYGCAEVIYRQRNMCPNNWGIYIFQSWISESQLSFLGLILQILLYNSSNVLCSACFYTSGTLQVHCSLIWVTETGQRGSQMSLIFLDLPLPNLMVNPFQQTKTNTYGCAEVIYRQRNMCPNNWGIYIFQSWISESQLSFLGLILQILLYNSSNVLCSACFYTSGTLQVHCSLIWVPALMNSLNSCCDLT